jgi:predicted O-methyltransferase YrrM
MNTRWVSSFVRRRSLPVHMAAEEFSQLLAVMHRLAARRCLEWGSGGSTQAVLEQCPSVERYVSIEHDRAWYERVRQQVRDPRLELYYLAPEVPIPARSLFKSKRRKWNARAEVERSLLAGYIDFPATLGVLFDVVLVDGRARNFCLSAGWRLLRPGGVLVLHDAQRRQYRAALCSLGTPELLEPYRQGQMGLLVKPALQGSW